MTDEVSSSRPRSALATRLTFGIPILATVIGLLAWDHASSGFIGLGLLALFFGSGGALEFARMNQLGRRLEVASVLLVLLLLFARALLLRQSGGLGIELDLLILATAPFALLVLMLGKEPGQESLKRTTAALFGVLYVGLPLVCILELGAATTWGIEGILFLVLVVKGNDSGAYLVGRKWGRTPLIKVSPKKTREGALGGVVVGTAIGAVLASFGWAGPFGIGAAVAVSICIGIAVQLGDLVESYLKRSAGVKDSGNLIPQFGGILDLLDSILFAGPILLAIVHLWPFVQ